MFDNEGVWGTTEESIANTAESYFQQLFTSANPANVDIVLDLVDSLVTPTMNATLLQRYTPEEVRLAQFQMHPSKAPGPNGMFPFFFQKF